MKKWISFALIFVLISVLTIHWGILGEAVVHADSEITSPKNIIKENDLNAIVWGNDRFVTVGEHGIIKSSQDGLAWKNEISGVVCDLNDVIWDGNQFVAVGSSGILITSKNGTDWTQKTIQSNTLNSISFNGQIYIVIGNHGTIITSQNLQVWENRETDTACDFYGIAYHNGLFIVVGANKTTGVLLSSGDGLTWVKSTSFKSAPLKSIIWGNDEFVAVEGSTSQSASWNSAETTTGILTSKNGSVWTYSNISESNREVLLTSGINRVFWASARYIAVGGNGIILSTKDSSNWNSVQSAFIGNINGIAWNGELFVTVGDLDTVLNSKDGLEWTNISGNRQKGSLKRIEIKGDRYVVVGDNGQILVSCNGEEWERIELGYKDSLMDITWTGKHYIAVGRSSDGAYPVVLYSSDGMAWTREVLNQISIGQDCWLNAVVWAGDKVVAVGSNGLVVTSLDGVNWSEINSKTSNSLLDIVWNGKKLVSVGEDGTILISLNGGLDWNEFKNQNGRMPLIDILWDGTRFVALGGIETFSMIFTSVDGEHWISCTDSEKLLAPLNGIAWNGKQLAAVGPNGTMLLSIDGVKWDHIKLDTENNLETIRWDGEKFISVGEKDDIITWLPKDLVKVKIDGKALPFDVAPRIIDGRTLVPMRTIFEALGLDVKWDEGTKSITANKGQRAIELKVGSTNAYIDGIRKHLDVPATILNGRTMVPLRFISEGTGGIIDWNKETSTAYITTK